jgi:outer membrane receptor protein involved in Fe transport
LRVEWQENYQFAPKQFLGSHQFKVGLNYAHSSYEGRETFLPATIADATGTAIEQIAFTAPSRFDVSQNETAWFAGDQWSITPRVVVSLGARFDNDSLRAHALVATSWFPAVLTRDSKTTLKGGGGILRPYRPDFGL